MQKYPAKYPPCSEFSAENLQHKAPELGIYKFYELSEPVFIERVPDYVSLKTVEKSAWQVLQQRINIMVKPIHEQFLPRNDKEVQNGKRHSKNQGLRNEYHKYWNHCSSAEVFTASTSTQQANIRWRI